MPSSLWSGWVSRCLYGLAILVLSGSAVSVKGQIYLSDGTDNAVYVFNPTGTRINTIRSPLFSNPEGIALDSSGNLYVAEDGSSTVSRVSTSGAITTFNEGFDHPNGLVFDAAGNLYVSSDSGPAIEKVTPQGDVTHFSFSNPQAASYRGLAIRSDGTLFAADFNDGSIFSFSPTGTPTMFATGLDSPEGIAFDPGGNLFVSSFFGQTVSKISPTGQISLYTSGITGGAFGLAFDSNNDLLVVHHPSSSNIDITEFSPTGSSQTLVSGLSGDPNFIAIYTPVPEPAVGTVACLAIAILHSRKSRPARQDRHRRF